MPRSKPIIVTQAILTGLGILFGASLLADVIDPRIVGLGALLVVATKGGIDFYVAATTVPSATVVATQAKAGEPVVAGPRADATTGSMVSPHDRIAELVPSAPPAVDLQGA